MPFISRLRCTRPGWREKASLLLPMPPGTPPSSPPFTSQPHRATPLQQIQHPRGFWAMKDSGTGGGFLTKPPLQCCQLHGEAGNPGTQPCIPPVLPSRALPRLPKPTPKCRRRMLCGCPILQNRTRGCSAPKPYRRYLFLLIHSFLGSKGQPQSRIRPTHSIWKVIVREGRGIPLARHHPWVAASTGAAASPHTAWQGAWLQGGSGRAGAWDGSTGGGSLPASTEGWVCREGRT